MYSWCISFCMHVHNADYILNCINYHFSFSLQLSLPTEITVRYGHSAVQFGTGPDFRLVIFFGGSKTGYVGIEISETTLLLLCKS